MQRKLPWMLFAASMALNILFVSGFLVGQASSGQADSAASKLEEVAERLSLSDEQRQGLVDLRGRLAERRAGMRDQKQAQRQAMWAEMAKPEFDRAAFEDQLSARFDQRRDFFVEFAESLHGYLATLSPEQRTDFIAMAEERGFMRKLFFKRRTQN